MELHLVLLLIFQSTFILESSANSTSSLQIFIIKLFYFPIFLLTNQFDCESGIVLYKLNFRGKAPEEC